MKTKVLIADDHSVVRSGLKMVLESSGKYDIVAEAEDGEMALRFVEEHGPALVIMDVSMPGMGGIEATHVIRRRYSDVKILVLTVHDDEEYVYQMLKAGANGYLLKSAGKEDIFAACDAVLAGAAFFSPTVSDIIIQRFVDRAGKEEMHRRSESHEEAESPLTPREREVLVLIAEGMTNREIGDKLYISVRTVNTHRANIMGKLELHDTASLVRYAIGHGLLEIEDDGSSGG